MARLPQHLTKGAVGRQPLSREELSRHQRDRILTAAAGVFARRGYQATTVDNVVSAAGIGVGSFYAHFEGKQDCLLAAYEKVVGEALEQIDAALPANAPWPQQALAVIGELLASIAAEPNSARLALVEIQTGGATALERYEETVELATAALAGARQRLDLSPEPPRTLEDATVNGLAWLLAQRLVRGEAKEAEELFRQVAEIVLSPYLGAPQTRREIALFESAHVAA